MDLRIERADDGSWTLYRAGVVVASDLSHEAALAAVTAELNAAATEAARLAVNQEDALLPEEWVAPIMCESAATGPTRDFSECVWTSRDPATNLVPLMLSTTTEMGAHIGARLVGFFTAIDTSSDTPNGRGRFFATHDGEEARDLLLGVDRFGVSVDPSENVEYRFECVQMSDDGWCEQERIVFEAYEIAGMTMTTMPGFERAYITLDASATPPPPAEEEPADDTEEGDDAGEGDDAEAAAGVLGAPVSFPAGTSVARIAALAADLATSHSATREQASAAVRSAGRAGHAATAPCCDACASSRTGGHRTTPSLVASGSAAPARALFEDPQLQRLTPLTITDDGEVVGHLAPWGQCHTGSPMGECVLTPRSLSAYANFRTGYVVTAEGDEIPTGRLTLGGGHADLRLSHRGAVEHYDNAGSAIADLACGEDAHGVWVHGSVRAGVTTEQIAAARASSPSGDWRMIGVGLELVAALCVNQPGFVVARVASGHIESLCAAGAVVMSRLSLDPNEARISRLERELADVRGLVTAPARAALTAMARDRVRAQLIAMR